MRNGTRDSTYSAILDVLGRPLHDRPPAARRLDYGVDVDWKSIAEAEELAADATWLGLARVKVATFTTAPFCPPPNALPQTRVAGVVRPFPDPYPIGLGAVGGLGARPG